jgi:hypothetical protein
VGRRRRRSQGSREVEVEEGDHQRQASKWWHRGPKVGSDGGVREAEVDEGGTSEVEDNGMLQAGDEAVVCSEAGIEDGRRRWHSGVQGDRRASAWRFQKFAKCCMREHVA